MDIVSRFFSNKQDEEKGSPSESTSLVSSHDENGHHQHEHRDGISHSHDDLEDGDGHEHTHKHNHSSTKSTDDPVIKRLKMATALCLTFMLLEVIGGYLAGSLAVLSDAAHLMADLASFAVAIAAAYLGARPSTPQHTYGLKRTESLAALFSMVTLAVLSIILALEAIRRIGAMVLGKDTDQVDGKLMSGIAAIGVLVNLALAAVLGEHHTHLPGQDHGHDHDHDHGHGHEHSHEQNLQSPHSSSPMHSNEVPPESTTQPAPKERNVNLQAAYLHVLADLTQSVAVLVAGLIIWWKPSWKIVDPIATILFCCLVIWSTLGVIRSAICVLLEEVPPHISWQTIHTQIEELVPAVTDIHDLHIWSISHGINALSVHVVLEKGTADTVNSTISKIARIARKNGINHSTVQVQTCDSQRDCITCAMADESQSCVAPGYLA